MLSHAEGNRDPGGSDPPLVGGAIGHPKKTSASA